MRNLFRVFLASFAVLYGCTAEQNSAQVPIPEAMEVPKVEEADRPTIFTPTRDFPDAEPATRDYLINLESVHKIKCDNRVGTGEVINTNTILTASHVVRDATQCSILKDGEEIPGKVVFNSHSMDYAVIEAPTGRAQRFPISCDGFQTGFTYFAIGHAHGTTFAITRAVATDRYQNLEDRRSNQPFEHVRTLVGQSYEGMSGGPIVDMRGYQVGTVVAGPSNKRPLVFARELKDTFLCRPELAEQHRNPPSERDSSDNSGVLSPINPSK